MGWSGGIAEWTEQNTAFISVVFSWKLPEAYQRVAWYRQAGYDVKVGGGGIIRHPNYFDGVAEVGEKVNALQKHNPHATRASRGCPLGCDFCIVPETEGRRFVFILDFIPRPILCDNNLSALPRNYQAYIIQKYLDYDVPLMDANSGFHPKTFHEGTYKRWKTINRGAWRLGYDQVGDKEDVYRSIKILKDEPPNKKRIYVLIGNEPFEQCYGRIKQVIEWGCEPHVQPLMALDTLVKKPVIKYDWTEKKLRDLARWSNRWLWKKFDFEEYK